MWCRRMIDELWDSNIDAHRSSMLPALPAISSFSFDPLAARELLRSSGTSFHEIDSELEKAKTELIGADRSAPLPVNTASYSSQSQFGADRSTLLPVNTASYSSQSQFDEQRSRLADTRTSMRSIVEDNERSDSRDRSIAASIAVSSASAPAFMSSAQKLAIDAREKGAGSAAASAAASMNNPNLKRKFVPPIARDAASDASSKLVGPAYLKKALDSWADEDQGSTNRSGRAQAPAAKKQNSSNASAPEQSVFSAQVEEMMLDERLAQMEPKMIESILTEILQTPQEVRWSDIGGLENAKKSVEEAVIWPLKRPDLFTGLRAAPKGLLLFGPPGTGKTMIARVLAFEAKATFFSISASSLTSKWHGDGEKLVRTLFAIARVKQPSVIFIDEIDSLLTSRSDGEFEASRRIKTEFLICLDGAGTSAKDRILIVGATNRPQDIDEAARRRMVKRLYIPLPDANARRTIVLNLLRHNQSKISEDELQLIVQRTDGYSGSDLKALCEDAGLGPMRELTNIDMLDVEDVRPILYADFETALTEVRASVAPKDLLFYEEWNKTFGSFR